MTINVITPHPIHRFFAWLDRIALPAWIFYLLLLFIPGLALQINFWMANPNLERSFDPFFIFFFAWLVEGLALVHFITKASKKLLDDYRPQLSYDEVQFDQLRQQFTTISSGMGSVFFVVGALIGYFTAQTFISGFPGLDRGLPLLLSITYAISFGFALMGSELMIRQLRLIQKLFHDTVRIQISNLVPIYSFSRYTAIIAIWLFFITYVNGALIMPEVFENPASAASIYLFMALSASVFYLPLRGINQHLIRQKEDLMEDVNSRIEKTFLSIHAAQDENEYKNILALRSMLSALKDERELIDSVPTWPWRPGTITGLISALLLPTILSLISGVFERFLGF